jgi:hypothetical protein
MTCTVVKIVASKPGAAPGWFADIVKGVIAQPHGTIPSMVKVGCPEILTAVTSTGVELIFVWDASNADQAERAALVTFWATKVPGTRQTQDAQAVPTGLSGTAQYVPDVYGRPCSPPPQPGGGA